MAREPEEYQQAARQASGCEFESHKECKKHKQISLEGQVFSRHFFRVQGTGTLLACTQLPLHLHLVVCCREFIARRAGARFRARLVW